MPPFGPERWRTLSPYLDKALSMSPERRREWLASITSEALHDDLQRLLAEHEDIQKSRFLERAVDWPAPRD